MRVVFVLLVVNNTISFDKCLERDSFTIDILPMAPNPGNRVPISKFHILPERNDLDGGLATEKTIKP
jgi:hypothetical protein